MREIETAFPAATPPRCKQSQPVPAARDRAQRPEGDKCRTSEASRLPARPHLRDALLAAAVVRDVGGGGAHVHRHHITARPARRQGRGHQQEDGGPEPLPLRPQLRPRPGAHCSSESRQSQRRRLQLWSSREKVLP